MNKLHKIYRVNKYSCNSTILSKHSNVSVCNKLSISISCDKGWKLNEYCNFEKKKASKK